MGRNVDWDILSTIASLIIASIAVWMSSKAIRISNKQYLFDERLKAYRIFCDLYTIYKCNETLLFEEIERAKKSDNNVLFNSVRYLNLMTDKTAIFDIHKIVNKLDGNLLEESADKKDIKFNFNNELDRLRNSAESLTFLFKKNNTFVPMMTGFINAYVDYLDATFDHYILISDLAELNRKYAQDNSKPLSDTDNTIENKQQKYERLAEIAQQMGIDSDIAFLIKNKNNKEILKVLRKNNLINSIEDNKLKIILSVERLQKLSGQIEDKNVICKIEKKSRIV